MKILTPKDKAEELIHKFYGQDKEASIYLLEVKEEIKLFKNK